jgi:hypothetical protein
MQSHADHIQAILARELDMHRCKVALVQASLLTVPPRSSGIAAVAGVPLGRPLADQALTGRRAGAASATA